MIWRPKGDTVGCMRLHKSMDTVRLPRKGFSGDVLTDMQALFAGQISTERNGWRVPILSTFVSIDRNVAGVRAGVRPRHTTVKVGDPNGDTGANQWVALQAYAAKGGVNLKRLEVQVPGKQGYMEWYGRSRVTVGALAARANLAIDDVLAGQLIKESARSAEEIDVLEEGRTGSYMGLLRGLTDANGDFSAKLVPSHGGAEEFDTVFGANGYNLPDAASQLTRGYDSLWYHSEIPHTSVPAALGFGSLASLESHWRSAMSQPTPRAAAQFILTGQLG